MEICKAINDDTGFQHFWFVKDDKVYTIYSWNNDTAIENTVIDLVKSAENSV